VHGSIAALIAERRAIHETDWPNDLLSRLMEARDPDTGEAMTETLLRDESITMFFAGHETTARTMAAAWYALGTHPEVAARLHEELDSVLGHHAACRRSACPRFAAGRCAMRCDTYSACSVISRDQVAARKGRQRSSPSCEHAPASPVLGRVPAAAWRATLVAVAKGSDPQQARAALLALEFRLSS
jgi:Cytochrome P450